MTIEERKQKLALAEIALAETSKRLKRTMTSFRLWEGRVRFHQKQLQKEMEVELIAAQTYTPATTGRKFR